MRQIKFRGKRIDNLEWVFGDLIENQGRFFIYHSTSETTIKDNDNGYITIEAVEIDNSTIGQFTGLTDKEGKEIYEGDILDFHNMLFNSVAIYNEEESAFCLKLIGSKLNGFNSIGSYQSLGYELTILGNRWDNPELLKGGEE